MHIRSIALYTVVALLSRSNNTVAFTSLTTATTVNGKSSKPTSQSYKNGEEVLPVAQPTDTSNDGSEEQHDPFAIWSKMRLGLGSGPGSHPASVNLNDINSATNNTNTGGVFWVGSGALYHAYSGKIIALFEGFDIGKGVQLSPNHVRQLSRKIFWFKHPISKDNPQSGQIMKEYEGKEVKPIVYDCQMIDYHKDVESGSITYSVEASLRNLKHQLPKMEIATQLVGSEQMMIQVPVFVDIPIPSAKSNDGNYVDNNDEEKRYQAWEFYDYNLDLSFNPSKPPTAAWCRQGAVPPFNMNSNAVLRFSGCRVDSFEELPVGMREIVEREYPHFASPPRDEKEVEEWYGVE